MSKKDISTPPFLIMPSVIILFHCVEIFVASDVCLSKWATGQDSRISLLCCDFLCVICATSAVMKSSCDLQSLVYDKSVVWALVEFLGQLQNFI